ncbi:hypothetical protein [Burkholderia sp. GS2Y]|uniref:Uncharacterized protein n=1 Tax=Burkholderia theae TaxID=3143496 RepID=A0ABU9WGG9_9BURK
MRCQLHVCRDAPRLLDDFPIAGIRPDRCRFWRVLVGERLDRELGRAQVEHVRRAARVRRAAPSLHRLFDGARAPAPRHALFQPLRDRQRFDGRFRVDGIDPHQRTLT